MRDLLAAARRCYGAQPLHLISLLACFALTGYVVEQLAGNPSLPRVLAWFGGAIVAHDLIAFPIYALADRAAARTPRRRGSRCPHYVNYLRVPAAGSALLLVVYLPGIIRQGGHAYHAATGQSQQPFLVRWLLLTAVLFAASALAYAIGCAAGRRARRVHTR
ncbi:MAG TPA: hypothetical protein VJ851_09340 [Jatrophihabitans sp.]|nr:hypothetical protein [Jatrophihabitans sp.]